VTGTNTKTVEGPTALHRPMIPRHPGGAVTVRAPVLRAITDADVDRVARFFHVHHNSALSVETYRRSLVSHNGGRFADHGIMLVDGDDVVGA
jgi:hypothetical protein